MSPHLMIILGVVAIFVGVVAVILTLGASASDRQQVGRSLAALDAMSSRREEARRELDRPFAERVFGPIVTRLSRIGSQFSPRDESAKLRHRIDLAGNPAGWNVERILAFKVIGLMSGLLVGIGLPLGLGGGLAVTAGVTVLLVPLGYFAPDLALYQIAFNRNERIRRDLP